MKSSFDRYKLDQKWIELGSFHSEENFSLTRETAIDYYLLAYDQQDQNEVKGKWWSGYRSRKEEFCNLYCSFLKDRRERSAGVSKPAGEDTQAVPAGEMMSAALSDDSHLQFAEWMLRCFENMQRSSLFRSAVQKKGLSLDKKCIDTILKPAYWRDSVSHSVGTGKEHYNKSSLYVWSGQGEDQVPPRDVIIQLCLQWKLGTDDTDHLLRCAGYAALYAYDLVDLICMYELDHASSDISGTDLLVRTKEEINHFQKKPYAYRQVKETGDRASIDQFFRENPQGHTFSSPEGRNAYKGNRQEALEVLIPRILGGHMEYNHPAEDYGLHQKLTGYRERPSEYRKNLFYSSFDRDLRITKRITLPKKRDLNSRSGEPYLPANLNLSTLVRSLCSEPLTKLAADGAKGGKSSEKSDTGHSKSEHSKEMSALNTIMSLNDLICPQELYDYPFGARGKQYVNTKKTSTRTSTVHRILEGLSCNSVDKTELVKYMLASGQEDDIGVNLEQSGFWKENYLGKETAFDPDEMDFTDYILVYAFLCRSRDLGPNTLENGQEYRNYSMIRLFMEITRSLQLLYNIVQEAFLPFNRKKMKYTEIRKLSTSIRTKAFLKAIERYSPYYVCMPRYLPDNNAGRKSSDEKEAAVTAGRKTGGKYLVAPNVFCAGWLADYEWEKDRERGNALK